MAKCCSSSLTPSPRVSRARITKALPSAAALSTHDAALIKGIAPVIHEHVRREIEKAVAPLKAEIAQLKTLHRGLEASYSGERRGHSDGGGPDYYWRQ